MIGGADIMARLLATLLLVTGCTEAAAPEPGPEPTRILEGRAEAQAPVMPEAPPGRFAFPQRAIGCYRCDVTSLFYQAGDTEPRDEERSGAAIRIGMVSDDRPRLTATIEGCPFYVTGAERENVYALGPNRCDDTRYHDGFMLLHSESYEGEHIFRTLPTGEAVDCAPLGTGDCDTYTHTTWSATVQLTGRQQSGAHAIHTYRCMRGRCLR